MTKQKTEVNINTPVGTIQVSDGALLVMHNANRRDMRHLNKTLRKINPNWTGAVVALNDGESFDSLSFDQSMQLCLMLMKKHFQNVYETLVATMEKQVEEEAARIEAEGEANEQEDAVEAAE